MKAIITKALLFGFAAIAMVSCRSSFNSTTIGGDKDIDPNIKIISDNEYVLEPMGEIVQYTIDVSTLEGRMLLKSIKSESDAKKLINGKAALKYQCDMFINPNYEVVWDGKKIIRLTLVGRPGVYMKKEK